LGAACRDQRQMALAADQQLGAGDQGPGLRRQAGEPVFAEADDREPGAHDGSPSSVTSSALTAAAASALPPRRPRRVRNGIPRSAAISASFDSAAPTNPTGNASSS